MTTETHALDITLLGRDYRVACAPEEKEALLAAVAFLEERMQLLADRTKSSGERLAVMTALNLAHELLFLKLPGGFDMHAFRRRISAMDSRLDEALAQQNSLF
ncbi:MAG: cell division protein ZapA [Rhodocyclaceae bacterium]|nr:cell division protein ZapA [Rhodocyclaceae bacterium]